MTGAGVGVPVRWRGEGTSPRPSRARRWRILLLLLLAGLLVAAVVGMLYAVRPIARTHLVVLCLPGTPGAGADAEALAEGDYFHSTTSVPTAQLDRRTIERELAALASRPTSDNVTVYLSGPARTDAAGRVHLLPRGADLDDSSSWLSLRRVLELLARANAPHLLLILDLGWPLDGSLVREVPDRIAGDLEAVPDPRRLVLCSCEANQRPHFSEYLGRSIFGHYVEDGLRGRADLDSDGTVTARELASFVRARVDRWTRRTRLERQTPILRGEGADFALVQLDEGKPLPPRALPEPSRYPRSLIRAWKKATLPASRQALLVVERDWRRGAGMLEQGIKAALGLPPAKAGTGPAIASLAASGVEADRDVADAVRQLVVRVELRVRNLTPDKAAGEMAKQVDDFLKANKDIPDAKLFQSALAVALNDARGATLRLIDALVRRRQEQPAHVETLQLSRLARLELSAPTARLALQAIADGARMEQPRAFAWTRDTVTEAARLQHEGLVLLQSPGHAPLDQAVDLLKRATGEQRTALAQQQAVDEARKSLANARLILPQVSRYLDHTRRSDSGWLETASVARELSQRLQSARARGSLVGAIDDIRRLAATLSRKLDDLRSPFTEDGVEQAIKASKRPGAAAGHWQEADALLATTLVRPVDRALLWDAAANLSRRLEDEVFRLDRAESDRTGELPPAPPLRPEDLSVARGLKRAQRKLALLKLDSLPEARLRELARAMPAKPDRAALVTFDDLMRTTSRDRLPRPADGTELWPWLADQYRYLAREYAALDPGSPLARYFAKQASGSRPWLTAAREEYATVAEANDPPRLLPGKPIMQQLEIRSLADPKKQVSLTLNVLMPDTEWLDVKPGVSDLSKFLRLDQSALVSLTIALKPSAGRGKAPIPLGMMAKVRLGDRAYHRKIPVPLVPSTPEIVIATNDKKPDPAFPRLYVRAGAGKQTYHVFVRNPIDRVYEKVQLRLVAGTITRDSAVFRLGPRELKKVPFAAVPPPATPAAAPQAAPALTGPITLTLLDQDRKGEIVVKRELTAAFASPREYVEVTSVRLAARPGGNRLEVKLRQRATVPGGAITAALRFPAGDVAAPYTGTLSGTLPANGTELTLFADNFQLVGQTRKIFFVNIDGWARAFTYRVTPARGGTVTPERLDGVDLRLRLGDAAIAGKTFAVPVEVDNAPPGASLEVSVGRLSGGAFRAEATAKRDPARQQAIGFAVGAGLELEGTLVDWNVPLDTSRIRGTREVQARLLDRQGRQLQIVSKQLLLGDSSPQGVRFVNPPEKAWAQKPLALKARGQDAVAGLKSVAFFLGKPTKDNKVPEGVKLSPGVALNDDATEWSGTLALPSEGRGPTDVSVRFVNKLGLSRFATISVELSATDPDATKAGTIKGKVTEGDRGQNGLEVVLTDEKGVEKARVKTKADGAYVFSDVAPGKYRVSSSKTSNGRKGSYPRTAGQFIELKPGATETADIVLFL